MFLAKSRVEPAWVLRLKNVKCGLNLKGQSGLLLYSGSGPMVVRMREQATTTERETETLKPEAAGEKEVSCGQ